MRYRLSAWVVGLFALLAFAGPPAAEREMYEPSSLGDRIPDQPRERAATLSEPVGTAGASMAQQEQKALPMFVYVHSTACQSDSVQADRKGKARLVMVSRPGLKDLRVAEAPR